MKNKILFLPAAILATSLAYLGVRGNAPQKIEEIHRQMVAAPTGFIAQEDSPIESPKIAQEGSSQLQEEVLTFERSSKLPEFNIDEYHNLLQTFSSGEIKPEDLYSFAYEHLQGVSPQDTTPNNNGPSTLPHYQSIEFPLLKNGPKNIRGKLEKPNSLETILSLSFSGKFPQELGWDPEKQLAMPVNITIGYDQEGISEVYLRVKRREKMGEGNILGEYLQGNESMTVTGIYYGNREIGNFILDYDKRLGVDSEGFTTYSKPKPIESLKSFSELNTPESAPTLQKITKKVRELERSMRF